MKVSILFITYKHEKFVAAAIQSALAQDYPNLELVVCDDGSPDRTREILEQELANCPQQIQVVRAHAEKNGGLHANFNRGLAACSGEIIVVMSGDDISRPNRVSMICQEFAVDSSCMLVSSNWIQIDDSGNQTGTRDKQNNHEIFAYSFVKKSIKNSIYAGAPVCGAVAAYRACLRDLFPPMEAGRHAEDNCFWVRALLVGKIRYLAEPLVFWRSHGDNQSNWQRGIDHPVARAKHLKFLQAHQSMTQQWTRDLTHALASKLISESQHRQLQQTVQLQRERYRLLRLSVAAAPWKLWLGSVFKLLWASAPCGLLRKSASLTLRKYLPLRLSDQRRDAYWHSYFNGMAR